MIQPAQDTGIWPELDYASSRDTLATLQLWTQIVGKVRIAHTPWLNHGWQVPLYVTARGLSSSPIPVGNESLEIEFDFIAHRLACRTSLGREAGFTLGPQPVAVFYEQLLDMLSGLGMPTSIHAMPNEVAAPIAFAADLQHRSYDAPAVHRFWRVLLQADRVLKLFRTSFVGKASPVHFFWGSFDLAVTRFSGRAAPVHPGAPGLPDRVVRDAYSHEVSSAGFWPGSEDFPEAAFYSYAYPDSAAFRKGAVPPGGHWEDALGEFVLPYEVARAAADPDALIQAFLQATYVAAADAGGWDRAALECSLGRPRSPNSR